MIPQVCGDLGQVMIQQLLPAAADRGSGDEEVKKVIGRSPLGLPGGEVHPCYGVGDGLGEGDAPVGLGGVKFSQEIPAGAVGVGEEMLGAVSGLVAELGDIPRGHGGVGGQVGLQVGDDG